jgi:hypothetical protein
MELNENQWLFQFGKRTFQNKELVSSNEIISISFDSIKSEIKQWEIVFEPVSLIDIEITD